MKKIIIFINLLACLVFLVGCEEDELERANYVTFESSEANIAVEQNGSGSLDVKVFTTLISGSDRTFDLVLDEASSLTTDAYMAPTSVTIPADSNEAVFTIDFTDSGISNAGDVLIFSFMSKEGLYVGEPLTVSVTRDCPSDLAGDYEYVSLPGYPVSVVEVSPKVYSINRDDYFGAEYSFQVTDVCDNLSVTSSVVESDFGIPTYGTGSVDPDTGNLTIIYTIEGYFENRTMVLEKR